MNESSLNIMRRRYSSIPTKKKRIGLVIYKIKKEGTIRYGYEVGVAIEKRWKGSIMWWGDPLPKID